MPRMNNDYEWLFSLKPCDEGAVWALEQWNNSVPFHELWDRCPNPSWMLWVMDLGFGLEEFSDSEIESMRELLLNTRLQKDGRTVRDILIEHNATTAAYVYAWESWRKGNAENPYKSALWVNIVDLHTFSKSGIGRITRYVSMLISKDLGWWSFEILEKDMDPEIKEAEFMKLADGLRELFANPFKEEEK